jgi:hypothetical protein
MPANPVMFARGILAKVTVEPSTVTLRTSESSHAEVRVRNAMPGTISLSVDNLPQPGLKITPAKTQLNANEEVVVAFDYRVDDAAIACSDCAKRLHGTATAQLRIQPTNQVLPVTIVFTRSDEPEPEKPKK